MAIPDIAAFFYPPAGFCFLLDLASKEIVDALSKKGGKRKVVFFFFLFFSQQQRLQVQLSLTSLLQTSTQLGAQRPWVKQRRVVRMC